MATDAPDYAPEPPAGWNSFDCFGSSVTEAEVLANAEVLARELLPGGYDTVVVDYCWSHPSPGACSNPNQAEGFQPLLAIDTEHRLLPAPERFPSSRGGRGFAPLAARIHAMGLKFGIHIMRGFPRQALYPAFPSRIGGLHPGKIADPDDVCSWLNHMCGVRATSVGQAYYDSLFRLYAEWGVDYVKVDDMTFPYHASEIEMVDQARRRCGRPMTLSLSPGACPVEQANHVGCHAELWRVSPDFWDRWDDLRRAFDLCRAWAPYRRTGAWPDLDMLPVGRLSRRGPAGPERESYFTAAEQRTLLTLWSFFKAPLFVGGDLTVMDRPTLDLLRDPLLAHIRKNGDGATCVRHSEGGEVWRTNICDAGVSYYAVFNLGTDFIEPLRLLREAGVDAEDALRARDVVGVLPKSGGAELLGAHDVALYAVQGVLSASPGVAAAAGGG